MTQKPPSLFDKKIAGPAILHAFRKLDPRLTIKNPVMFTTQVGAVLTTAGILTSSGERGFVTQLAIWLWFTVLFANFAEAVAEGRGKAQAESLRKARKDAMARRLRNGREEKAAAPDLPYFADPSGARLRAPRLYRQDEPGRLRQAPRWLQGFLVHHAQQVGVAHYLDAADFLDVPGAGREVAGDIGELFQVVSVDQVDRDGVAAVGYASSDKYVFSGCAHGSASLSVLLRFM